MAINNFKPFALDPNANVTSQADWEALPALLSGFTAGKASSAQVNKAIRQASFIAAALAQYTANKSRLDVLDDGDLNGFISKMGTAFGKDFQALDATLSALAGLATGANKLPYFTGNDTAAQTDLTSVGRDIIGKNTIADILTYLGIDRVEQLNNETRIYTGADGSYLSARGDGQFGIFDPSRGFIPLGVQQGGTGARDAGGARTNLGLGSVATENTVPVAKGGTGGTTAAVARTNLALDRIEQRAGETVIFSDDNKNKFMTARSDNSWGYYNSDLNRFIALPIQSGGTGANDAPTARDKLGLGNAAVGQVRTGLVSGAGDKLFSTPFSNQCTAIAFGVMIGQAWMFSPYVTYLNKTGFGFDGRCWSGVAGTDAQPFIESVYYIAWGN